MKAYSIFDDFTEEATKILEESNVDITIHPLGVPRPDSEQMKRILETYDCVIIGTSQKITEDMFENIHEPRIIATASVGLDHICIPKDKRDMIQVINTPKANAKSVAEYTIGCALTCVKRIVEGDSLYRAGKNNKSLYKKPEDLNGKKLGVIGAGNISTEIMRYAGFFGMDIFCWTRNPERHQELANNGIKFLPLEELVGMSDVISFNLPNKPETYGMISRELIDKMKENCIFISVSRKETMDINALFDKAKASSAFYVCLDIDLTDEIVSSVPDKSNVIVTPHIAGGTVETRKRMFKELSEGIVELI